MKLGTQIIKAENEVNQTISLAQGTASKIFQEGRAAAAIAGAYVDADADGYGIIKEELNLDGDGILKYIWYDVLGSGGIAGENRGLASELFVGITPGAYLQVKGD